MHLSMTEQSKPDPVDIDDKSKGPHHPCMNTYWGDVDNESSIYFFTQPSENYRPIKLVSLDVSFMDHEQVSFHLNNLMTIH